ncbi:MAG: hypothetical protein JF607_02235 [Burkholderiales bacterium]|nr:hypothetical protein [Burkholderiales bacterium]
MKTFVRALILCTLVAAQGVAGAGPRYYGPPQHYHHHHGGVGLGGLVLGLAVAVPLIALASQAGAGHLSAQRAEQHPVGGRQP